MELRFTEKLLEAGVDEAGRGCLAGPVVAAAVILPDQVDLPGMNDSKQLSEADRNRLRPMILEQAIAWGVGIIPAAEIDHVNILNATYLAMHQAIASMHIQPECLTIDGNRFKGNGIPYCCQVKGDARFLNIAAASILAKTFRDDIMAMLHSQDSRFGWNQNKGYPTREHREAIRQYGTTRWHRMSFQLLPEPTLFDIA